MTLKQWRTTCGFSLRKAAAYFGWSHARQLELETARGGRSPTLRTVDNIERLTGGTVTRLDWPKGEP